jgi:hypothetical protein
MRAAADATKTPGDSGHVRRACGARALVCVGRPHGPPARSSGPVFPEWGNRRSRADNPWRPPPTRPRERRAPPPRRFHPSQLPPQPAQDPMGPAPTGTGGGMQDTHCAERERQGNAGQGGPSPFKERPPGTGHSDDAPRRQSAQSQRERWDAGAFASELDARPRPGAPSRASRGRPVSAPAGERQEPGRASALLTHARTPRAALTASPVFARLAGRAISQTFNILLSSD